MELTQRALGLEPVAETARVADHVAGQRADQDAGKQRPKPKLMGNRPRVSERGQRHGAEEATDHRTDDGARQAHGIRPSIEAIRMLQDHARLVVQFGHLSLIGRRCADLESQRKPPRSWCARKKFSLPAVAIAADALISNERAAAATIWAKR